MSTLTDTSSRRVAVPSWLQNPALGLFFLAPLVAEFFLGDFPLTMIFAIIPLALWYGGSAILIREVTRRRGLGWPSILLLGSAFAVVEEGLLTMSLFNPDYAHAHLLDNGYLPALGISSTWTIYVLVLHIGWSIATPIALMEAIAGRRAAQPWLGRRGLIITAVCVVLGAAFTVATSYPVFGHFLASPAQIISCLAIVAVCVTTAFTYPMWSRRWSTTEAAQAQSRRYRSAPAVWLVFAVVFLGAGVFQLGVKIHPAWLADTTMAVAIVVVLATLGWWSRADGWSRRHTLAAASAMLLTYTWHAFFNTGVVPSTPAVLLISRVVYAVAAVAILYVCRRRVGRGAAQDRAAVTSADSVRRSLAIRPGASTATAPTTRSPSE